MARKKNEQKEPEIQEKSAELVFVIYNAGHSDKLFEVAKKLGINGGTFLNAHGMSKFEAEKFFNIAVEPEKEIALMVVNSLIKDKLLSEIYDTIGPSTAVQGIAFSVKVDSMSENLSKQLFPEEKTDEEQN